MPWEALGWTAALLAGGVYLYHVDPASSTRLPPCPLHWLTGCHCPGCGTLRAAHQLLHGHLAAALRYNVLTVLLLPLLAAMALEQMGSADWGCGVPHWKVTRRVAPVIPWAICAFWLLRNLPAYPFTLLAPHGSPERLHSEKNPQTVLHLAHRRRSDGAPSIEETILADGSNGLAKNVRGLRKAPFGWLNQDVKRHLLERRGDWQDYNQIRSALVEAV